MKNYVLLLFLFILVLASKAQEQDSLTNPKATVYFTRASGLGTLINFTFFDGEKAIGRFNGGKYMKYECEPGEHLFWARSENKSFVEAELLAGETYIIDVIPQMGAIKASVVLVPVDKNNYKLKPIQKLLASRKAEYFSDIELENLQNEMKEVIERGLEKYHENKNSGHKISKLLPEMTVQKSDLIFVKKK